MKPARANTAPRAPTWLHRQRLEAVLAALRRSAAETVLDLGCGDGALLFRLAQSPRIRRVIGVDSSAEMLDGLRAKLEAMPAGARDKVGLLHASMSDPGQVLAGFDAAVLVETIEHIDPDRLSMVERAVFGFMRPATVVITMPNRDFNPLLGVPAHRFRHPDHRFEWGRARFRDWATGTGRRNGYEVGFEDIAGAHPDRGGATQMGVFRRRACGIADATAPCTGRAKPG